MNARISWRQSSCLFLDVDGTLLEFAETPEAAFADRELIGILERVAGALDGALALISGRPIVALDRLFAPLRLPSAGVHGLERRNALGVFTDGPVDWLPMAAARHAIAALLHAHPALVVEDKGASLAVHWRRAPELEAEVQELMSAIAAQAGPDFELLAGASVLELKPCVRDKGTAVEAFLREPPFAGRVPLFVGDDTTDADAFLAVERHGGWAIGVGTRPSTHLRLADPPAVRRWLARLTSPSGLLA